MTAEIEDFLEQIRAGLLLLCMSFSGDPCLPTVDLSCPVVQAATSYGYLMLLDSLSRFQRKAIV